MPNFLSTFGDVNEADSLVKNPTSLWLQGSKMMTVGREITELATPYQWDKVAKLKNGSGDEEVLFFHGRATNYRDLTDTKAIRDWANLDPAPTHVVMCADEGEALKISVGLINGEKVKWIPWDIEPTPVPISDAHKKWDELGWKTGDYLFVDVCSPGDSPSKLRASWHFTKGSVSSSSALAKRQREGKRSSLAGNPSPSGTPEGAAANSHVTVDLTHRLLRAIGEADYLAYSELVDPSVSSFEPEGCGHLIKGIDFHKWYFDQLERKEGGGNVRRAALAARRVVDPRLARGPVIC